LVYGVDSNVISVAIEIRWERGAQSVARNARAATTNAGQRRWTFRATPPMPDI
jgi:hypothetical protein